MNPAPSSNRRGLVRSFGPLLAMVGLVAGVGCDTFDSQLSELTHPLAPPWKPGNVHRPAASLPASLRRVAVLPLAATEGQELQSGREMLTESPGQVLTRSGLFEVVTISERQLHQWTGRRSLAADETLPRNLLVKVREETGCDGVLFARLTRFQSYPPTVVGWNLQLVAVPGAEIIWGVDEVADARNPGVVSGMQQLFRQRGVTELEARQLAASPRRLAEYSLETLFKTLPPR
ncbi:MAG: hypothetical protein WCS99_07195 [Limisphaerales bacterium]